MAELPTINRLVPGSRPGGPTLDPGALSGAFFFLTQSKIDSESRLQVRSKMSSFQLIFEQNKMAKATDRLQVVISLKTMAFLDVLSGKGTHGTTIPDAARTLIEQGIRRAIREGFLTADEIKKVQHPNS